MWYFEVTTATEVAGAVVALAQMVTRGEIMVAPAVHRTADEL